MWGHTAVRGVSHFSVAVAAAFVVRGGAEFSPMTNGSATEARRDGLPVIAHHGDDTVIRGTLWATKVVGPLPIFPICGRRPSPLPATGPLF